MRKMAKESIFQLLPRNARFYLTANLNLSIQYILQRSNLRGSKTKGKDHVAPFRSGGQRYELSHHASRLLAGSLI